MPDTLTTMGYLTEDGRHEGYLVPQFFDGQRGTGTTGGDIPDDHVATGPGDLAPDGRWITPTRPAGEVTGWVVCCDCAEADGFRSTTWIGPTFTRVPSKALEDLAARRVFATDDEVAYATDREDVEAAARDLWRAEHAFSQDALDEVESASRLVADARQRLDAAVAFARHGGATWAEVGRAAGMTRQSAQERWRGVDGTAP